MKKLMLLAAVAACFVATAAQAADTVFLTKGSPLTGEIKSMTATAVTIDARGQEQQVPVNEIRQIKFDGEPAKLTSIIRTGVAGGRYEDSLAALQELEQEGIDNPFVKQDVEFLKTYSLAKMAINGNGNLQEAGSNVYKWVQANNRFYRYLEGVELLGDIFVATGRHDLAVQEYDKLMQAPWMDYKLRGGVAKGRALMASGQVDPASQVFQQVLSAAGSSEDPAVASLKQAATLGQAECLAAKGQVDQAVQMVEGIVQVANPEEVVLHARAYNTLGNCYRKNNDAKKALLAFLHVDVLYFTDPETHANALANLRELYNEIGDSKSALRVQQRLESRYPNHGS